MADDGKKKATDLGFDLTRQFLTLAFAGIAFVVGLSFNTPGAVSSWMLWLVIGAFGGSVLLGLLFFMHSISLLNNNESYDINARSLRGLVTSQIAFMLIGMVFIGFILYGHAAKSSPATHVLEIREGSARSVEYPIDPDKNVTVEIDGEKVKITAAKQ